MTERALHAPPAALRAVIAADLWSVRPLRSPVVRALALTPVALLLLLAAPVAFERRDLAVLGWLWSWGASALQVAVGLGLAVAALREAVPGRAWSLHALAWLLLAPISLVIAVTLATWQISPMLVDGRWWVVALVCLVSSAISALPAAALTSVLVLNAFPVRPGVAGLLAGLSGGFMADAGWRMFCHFSDPAHVLGAHLGGVLLVAAASAALTRWLARR